MALAEVVILEQELDKHLLRSALLDLRQQHSDRVQAVNHTGSSAGNVSVSEVEGGFRGEGASGSLLEFLDSMDSPQETEFTSMFRKKLMVWPSASRPCPLASQVGPFFVEGIFSCHRRCAISTQRVGCQVENAAGMAVLEVPSECLRQEVCGGEILQKFSFLFLQRRQDFELSRLGLDMFALSWGVFLRCLPARFPHDANIPMEEGQPLFAGAKCVVSSGHHSRKRKPMRATPWSFGVSQGPGKEGVLCFGSS